MGAPGRDAPCERSTTTRAAVSSSSTRSRCEGNAGARDIVVVGSFARAMSLGFALEIGVRGLIAHDAGVARAGAGAARLSTWGLDMAPKPATFGAPRGTRGAPLFRAGRQAS